LTDESRERVVDDERAHEEHDDGKTKTHVAKDVDEGAEIFFLFTDDNLTGDGLEVCRKYR